MRQFRSLGGPSAFADPLACFAKPLVCSDPLRAGVLLMYFDRTAAMRYAKLSVAKGAYNGELFLREQLDSIAAQTRLPDELWLRARRLRGA
jgi:hypothetical protein